MASEQLLYAAARDVSERVLTERYAQVDAASARVLADSPSIAQASAELLRVIGEGLGWQVAAFWTPAGEGPEAQLCRSALWTGAGVSATRFAAETERLRLARGAGLPGRVWESGESRWVPDVTAEPDAIGSAAAAADGLHASLLLPIRGDAGVLAVMEFLGNDVRAPEPGQLARLDPLVIRVGQFIERRAAEAALAASER